MIEEMKTAQYVARRASDAGPRAVSCHYRRDGFREPRASSAFSS